MILSASVVTPAYTQCLHMKRHDELVAKNFRPPRNVDGL